MRRGYLGLFVLACSCWTAGSALADESVVNSVHDLSVRGPGPIRAVAESEVCIFCHTPHNAAPQTPLWNRENPRRYYRIYNSSTTDARIDQRVAAPKISPVEQDGIRSTRTERRVR